jgi:hypothetical protein
MFVYPSQWKSPALGSNNPVRLNCIRRLNHNPKGHVGVAVTLGWLGMDLDKAQQEERL